MQTKLNNETKYYIFYMNTGEIKQISRTSWWINGFEVTQLLRQWANRNGVDLWYLKPGDTDKIEMDWCDYTTSEQRYSKETVERLKGKRHSSKSKTSSKKRKTNVKK